MSIRVFLSIVALSFFFRSTGQQNALFLIVTHDHRFHGVRNEAGDTIIPVEYHYYGGQPEHQKLQHLILDFVGLPGGILLKADSAQVAQTFYTTFDRLGKILYHPFAYDNGPDYVHEGLRRFVDVQKGKMGLVRPDGKIVISAEYDFLSPLENGYTTAHNGVKRITEDGGEHWSITPRAEGEHVKVVLNREGKIVRGKKNKTGKYTVFDRNDSLYYPKYYLENEKEKIMLDSLGNRLEVKKLFAFEGHTLDLKIFDRPRSGFPYYVIGEVASWKDYVLVDENGKLYYYDYLKPAVPLSKYLQRYKLEQ